MTTGVRRVYYSRVLNLFVAMNIKFPFSERKHYPGSYTLLGQYHNSKYLCDHVILANVDSKIELLLGSHYLARNISFTGY